MATPSNSPLNDDHLKQLNAALAASKVAETQITLAKQAGIDVAHQEAQLKDAMARIRAIKATYFPNSY